MAAEKFKITLQILQATSLNNHSNSVSTLVKDDLNASLLSAETSHAANPPLRNHRPFHFPRPI